MKPFWAIRSKTSSQASSWTLHCVLHIISLTSSYWLHTVLKTLNNLKLLSLGLSQPPLISVVTVRVLWEESSPLNYPLISLIQRINCCTVLLLVRCLQHSETVFLIINCHNYNYQCNFTQLSIWLVKLVLFCTFRERLYANIGVYRICIALCENFVPVLKTLFDNSKYRLQERRTISNSSSPLRHFSFFFSFLFLWNQDFEMC